MLNWGIIFTVCMVALVTSDEEPHEYGKYGEMRKAICEKQDRTIYEELYTCHQMESKAVKDATADCINKTVPSTGGNTIEFMEMACEDKSAFINFDKCMIEYESNAAYKKQMIVKNETVACYEAVLEKYGLQELKAILDEGVAAINGEHIVTPE